MHFQPVLLMSELAVKGVQLLAALSILIILHEFGHFFFARLFKTRVEKFYLFFDFLFPFSGLLNFSLIKKKKGDTEYGIGWFPLGGYVKIAGMVDESMDKDQLSLPPQPWEYRSKKAYQRLFIMLGGIIVNILLAIIIYIFVFGIYGEEYLPVKNAKFGIAVDSVARTLGLRGGDMLVSLDNKPVNRFETILPAMILDESKTIQVERNGQMVNINVVPGTIHSILTGERGSFIAPRIPMVVDVVKKGTEAEKMGFKHGDSVTAINGRAVSFFDQFGDTLKSLPAEQPITVSFIRDGQPMELKGTLPATKKLGVWPVYDADRYFVLEKITYSPLQAIPKGISYTYEKFKEYIKQFKLMFTSKEISANESLGGFISFGKIFPGEFHMQKFLMLTAFISIILAFMNLLPIPGLDGGYVIFLLYEIITGRQVSEKVMERATTVGLVLLLTLMVYANGLDIFRVFGWMKSAR